MRVKVRYLQEYYFAVGRFEEDYDLPGNATVRDLLARIPGQVRKDLLDSKGNLKPPADILVNGRSIRLLEGLDTRLHDGDLVVISPRPLFVV
ncbi:MAG: MoaD/ThiS family protein [Desulfurococcales archaeon]|nr:MoaD/ThiS family protein [Desulfurococcales archaeon]